MSHQLIGVFICVGITGLIAPRLGFCWLLVIAIVELYK